MTRDELINSLPDALPQENLAEQVSLMPDKNKGEMVDAIGIANTMDLDLDMVVRNRESFSNVIKNDNYLYHKYKRLKEAWAENYNQGYAELNEGLWAFELIKDGNNVEALEAIAESRKARMPQISLEEFHKSTKISTEEEGVAEDLVGAAGKLAPYMLEGLKYGADRGALLGGAALLAGAASGLGLPASVPLAAGLYGVGQISGMAEFAYKVESGLAYLEMLDFKDPETGERIDPNIARAVSIGIGVINSAIEAVQGSQLLKTIPGGERLVSGAIREAGKKLAKNKVFNNILARFVKRHGTFVGLETLEELAQESVTAAGEEIAKAVTNALKGTGIDSVTAEQLGQRMRDTAIQSAKGFTLLGLPGNVVSQYLDGMNGQDQQVKPKKESEKTEEVKPDISDAENTGIFDVTDEEMLEAMDDLATDEELETIISGNNAEREAVLRDLFNRTQYERFKKSLRDVLDEEQADAIEQLIEARAAALDMTADEYLAERGVELETGGEVTEEMLQNEPETFKQMEEPPKNSVKAYKLFRTLKTRPGEIFPLFIGKTKATPIGVWMEAEHIPTKGYAPRSGWHAGILPYAPHLMKKDGTMPEGRVWAEVEISADIDYQAEADQSPTKDIRGRIPEGGKYRFKTSKMQGGAWTIGGALKVNKILSQEEVDAINAAAPNILEQGQGKTKGAVDFRQEGKAIIHAFEGADVSTVAHELFHIFRRDLTGDELATIAKWAGVSDGKWTVEAEEKWARAGEKYLREGKAPTPALQKVFEKFKNWLREIYQTVKGSSIDVEITPEVREVLDSLFTEQETDFQAETGPVLQQVEGLENYSKWEPEQTSTGKYKGAPPWIKGRSDLTRMRRTLAKLVREGQAGRYWYEESAKKVLEITRGNYRDAEKLIQLIAIYSSQANVEVNTYFAIKAYNQWKNGSTEEEFKVKTRVQDRKATQALYHDIPFEGRKTDSFYLNLLHWIVENHPESLNEIVLDEELAEKMHNPVTVDMWMYRSLGYPRDSYGSDRNEKSGAYSFTENSILRLRDQLKTKDATWTGYQVQAAVWTAMKARYEDPAVKSRTWARSLKEGVATVNEKGRLSVPSDIEGGIRHRAIWREEAMKLTSAQATVNANEWSASFSDFFTKATSVITWEALPSESLGFEIFDAPDSVKDEFAQDALKLIVSDDGRDLLAEKLGIPLAFVRAGLGAYAGNVNRNFLSHLTPTKDAGEFTRENARAYARALQFIFRQDAVPWFRADNRLLLTKTGQKESQFRVINEKGNTVKRFDTLAEAQAAAEKKEGYSVRGGKFARGVRFTLNKSIDRQTARKILELLIEQFGNDAGFTRTAQNEITIINFRDDDTGVPFLDDEVFLDKIHTLVEANGDDISLDSAEPVWAESEYGYEQDWQSDPQGQKILSRRDTPRSSVLQGWLRDRQNAYDQIIEGYSGQRLRERLDRQSSRRVDGRGDLRSGSSSDERGGRARLVHWSRREGLKRLDPSFHGTGLSGAESKRKQADPGNWVDRTYFGVEGGKYRKEPGLGPHRYNTSIDHSKLYDFEKDPDGLMAKMREMVAKDPWTNGTNAYEKLIRDAGYAGYFTNRMGVVAAVFDEMDVESYQNEPAPGILLQQDEGLFSNALKGILDEDSPTSRVLRNTKRENFSDFAQFAYAMNRAALAARHAKIAGRREGTAAEHDRMADIAGRKAQKSADILQREKQRMRAILKRALDRKKEQGTRRELKARIRRELSNTKLRKNKKSRFGPEAQKALNIMRMASGMTQAEAQKALSDNLNQYANSPDPMPLEVVLENKIYSMILNLNSMDNAGLYSLVQDIKSFKGSARMDMIMAYEIRQAGWQADREAVIDIVSGGQGFPEGIETAGLHAYESQGLWKDFKRRMMSAGRAFVGWKDILDMLSFNSRTEPGKSAIDEIGDVLDSKNEEKQGVADAMAQFIDAAKRIYGLKNEYQVWDKFKNDNKMVSLGTFVNAFGKTTDLPFTKAQARKRVMELLDPSLDVKFSSDMGYTNEMVLAIRDMLDPEDFEFISWQMDFYQEYYNGINNVYREMQGVDLPHNKYYSPIFVEGHSGPVDSNPSGLSEFLQDISYRMIPKSGSLIARVSHRNPLKARSDVEVLQAHVLEMEHYKAWAERVRDLNSVFKDGKVKQAITLYYGAEMNTVIDHFLARFARGGSDKAASMGWLDKFRADFTRSVLAIKPSLSAKQLTSFIAYADAMPVHQFVKYVALFFMHPRANIQMLKDSSVLYATRGENLERDIKAAAKASNFNINPSFANLLMINIKAGDKGAIAIGGWAYYKYLVDNGASHEEAIRKFEQFTESTQQSSDESEQSMFQSGGSYAKVFTMFQSSVNQYLRKEIGAVRNWKAGRISTGKAAKTLVIYHVLLPMFFQLVSDRLDWDKDEQLRAALLGPLNGFFIIGDGLDSIMRTALDLPFDDFELSLFAPLKDIQRVIRTIKHDQIKAEDVLRIIRSIAGTIGAATGTPLKQAVDISTGVVDVAGGDVEQGVTEILGWSPYKAKELGRD